MPSTGPRRRALLLSTGVVFLLFAVALAAAQLQVLHSFTGGLDGANPAGLTIDGAGNLYGTTGTGGGNGFGVAYALRHGSGFWQLVRLHNFGAALQGQGPGYPVRDPHGNIYGALAFGGANGQGAIFQLAPAGGGKWTYRVIFNFTGGAGGTQPSPSLAIDAKGNLYGTTVHGGDQGCSSPLGCGTAFELSPQAEGGWTQKVIYTFVNTPGQEGATPSSGLTRDPAGNLYGVTFAGGSGVCIGLVYGCGVVYQLTPSSSGWQYSVLYKFLGGSDGSFPEGGVAIDNSGNLYGGTAAGGGATSSGVIYQLSPSGGGWNLHVLYTFQGGRDGMNVFNPVVLDQSANVYGTADGGANGAGVLFTVTQTAPGNWSYRLLHTFSGGSDGSIPSGNLVLDHKGNVYGTSLYGGTSNSGITFAIPVTAEQE